MSELSKKELFFAVVKGSYGYQEVGSFFNELEEEYFVYKFVFQNKSLYFVTGDELDWDTGWEFEYDKIQKQFVLNKLEIASIKDLIDTDKIKKVS